MEYIKLGETDLVVSKIGYGCEQLGGTDWGQFDEKQAVAGVSKALELGVNLFDTADIYGLGRSEKVLSKALGSQRHEVVIATKFGHNWKENPSGGRAETFFNSSPRRVTQALENSLKRLKIDCISLYQIHWPDPDTPIIQTMEALLKCQEAGKIKCVGVSNFPAGLVREAQQVMSIASVQLPYNIINRSAEEEITFCHQELGVGIIVHGPLAQGLLTGKYDSESFFGEDDRRHRLPHFHKDNLKKNLRVVDRVKTISKQYDKSPAQVALRWILDNPSVSCPITGVKTPAQIEDNIGALGWHLTESDRQYIASGDPA